MAKDDQKKKIKESLTNVLISLGAILIGYFAFNYFKPPIENLFLIVIFLLIFFHLESLNKK